MAFDFKKEYKEFYLPKAKRLSTTSSRAAAPQPAAPNRMVFCVDCGATYMESQGHDCPEK